MQDFSSGSEGEKESPPPEWDVPLKGSSRKFVKHVPRTYEGMKRMTLYMTWSFSLVISLVTMHTSVFSFYQKTVFSRSLCRPWMQILFWREPSLSSPELVPLLPLLLPWWPAAATAACSTPAGTPFPILSPWSHKHTHTLTTTDTQTWTIPTPSGASFGKGGNFLMQQCGNKHGGLESSIQSLPNFQELIKKIYILSYTNLNFSYFECLAAHKCFFSY